jgi:hypothetical protein
LQRGQKAVLNIDEVSCEGSCAVKVGAAASVGL